MGRLNQPAKPGYTYRSPGQTNARDLTPNLGEDVIASQRADDERMRKGLNSDAKRDYNRRLQQEAGGRAMLRTTGRAGLTSMALEGGYQAGRALDKKTGAGKKLVEETGLGRMAEKVAKPKEKVELSEYAKRRRDEEETDRTMREVDADIAEKKAYSGKDKEEKYRGDDYKKGGMTRARRFNDGGSTATYPFPPTGGAVPPSSTTVNVNGTTAATTAPEQAVFSAETQAMKKGGSVKGWGQARGARKAKVY